MCILLHNNRVGISGNIIYFLTCFVRILARNSVNAIFKSRDSPPWVTSETSYHSSVLTKDVRVIRGLPADGDQ